MNHDNAKQLLLELAGIFDSLELPFFLIQGTALGAYRDGDFIDGDTDIDIGFLWEDFKPKVQPLILRLRDDGYHVYVVDDTFDTPRILTVDKYGERADLVSFMLWNGRRFALAPKWWDSYALVFRASIFSSFDLVPLFGRMFNVPCPIDVYLELEYGNDWHKPTADNTSQARVYDFMKISGIDPTNY